MPTTEADADEVLRLLHKYGDVITQLLSDELTVHELALLLDPSQRTIRRVLETFDEQGLVVQEKNAYRLTQYGRQVAWLQCQHNRRISEVIDASEVLANLPGDAAIGCEMMRGVEAKTYPSSMRDVAFDPVEDSMESADRIRGISPEVRDRYVQLFTRHIFNYETEVELILEMEMIQGLNNFYSTELREAISAHNCSIWPAETVPAYGLIIVDEAEVWIGVYRNGGELMGTLYNDSSQAVAWAIDLFDSYREQADRVLNP
ncbi:helix-turn-helix transcriptional regulator [Halocatena marina]|uniref:helix-turn-helix transcriptional regulator n=1 Tax=Halocatena marina TaxID=2934937 RepID=UPI00200BE87E|nr:hypothetical protein [Halocatena marina]